MLVKIISGMLVLGNIANIIMLLAPRFMKPGQLSGIIIGLSLAAGYIGIILGFIYLFTSNKNITLMIVNIVLAVVFIVIGAFAMNRF